MKKWLLTRLWALAGLAFGYGLPSLLHRLYP